MVVSVHTAGTRVVVEVMQITPWGGWLARTEQVRSEGYDRRMAGRVSVEGREKLSRAFRRLSTWSGTRANMFTKKTRTVHRTKA